MDSPFAHTQKRCFVCHGKTRDRYLLPGGFPLRFDEFLFEHLRALNYRTLVFYNHLGLYFFDEESRNRVIVGVNTAPQAPASQPSPLASGPGGLSLRRKPAATPARPAADLVPGLRMAYSEMNRLADIQQTMRRLMKETRDAAIVFNGDHLLDFTSHNPSASVEQFRGLLDLELRQLPVDNRMIVLFVFGQEAALLGEHVRFNKPVLGSLYQVDPQGKSIGLAEAVRLGSPGQDEVRRLIDYYRLSRGLAVNWGDLDQTVRALTAYLKAEGKGILDLEKAFTSLATRRQSLDAASVGHMTRISLETKSAQERLGEMVGMDELKQELAKKIRVFEHWRNQQPQAALDAAEAGMERLCRPSRATPPQMFLHLALTGNPGTGKTTVAELVGEIYREAGLLELGHTVKVTRDDLVAGYVGQTALKTREKIEQALGGVLFIDEAYSLIQGGENDFGTEAVTTLLEAMSALRGEFMVIVAGYPKDIQKLIDSNSGFESRFSARIELPDMEPDQLEAVFRQQCARHRPAVNLAADLEPLLPGFFQEMHAQRGSNFGNARTVIEKLFRPMVDNLLLETPPTPSLTTLTARREHFPRAFQRYFDDTEHGRKHEPLEELDELIGLRGVKARIHSLIDDLRNDRERQRHGLAKGGIEAGHYLFVGNPGTGKTTVALLMARQFKRMGLLPTDRLVSRSAGELIGQYLGSTENRVQELLNEALGGVLFIDEAHQLAQEHGYGHNALRPFVPFMSNHKSEFSLVFAGYQQGIETLLAVDPGFRRRFQVIEFDDFSAEDLTQTFYLFVRKANFQASPSTHGAVSRLFGWMVENKSPQFGNAGIAERVFEMARSRLSARMARLDRPTMEERNTILLEDIPHEQDCHHLL